jgi:hypothetical protein
MATNLPLLVDLARRLRPLLPELVFVGGATVELYLTDPAAARPRVTRDVDVICEAESRLAYHRLGDRLRELGFREDQSPGAPVGRWTCPEGVLDVMAKEPAVLGFTNPWYDVGLQRADPRAISEGLVLRLLQAPLFVATKLAAYEGRGSGDPFSSHDIEDLVVVVSGRPELPDELAADTGEIRDWVAETLRRHLGAELEEIVAANLPHGRETPGLIDEVVNRVQRMMMTGSAR